MRYLKIFLFVLILIGVERFCYVQTGGFRVNRVKATLPYNKEWDTLPLSSEKLEDVGQILDQRFYFLDAGFQSYVFISEDKKSVLKLFKYHHLKPLPWLAALPLPETLKKRRDQYLKKRELRFTQTFSSFKIAHDLLNQETGLIYVHLNPTEQWKKQLAIVDKIGICHTLDLDITQFVLQTRVDRVYAKLDALMKEGKEEKARECITSIISLFKQQSKAGVMNKDPSIRRNIGFIEERAIFLDTGSLLMSENVRSHSYTRPKIIKSCIPFKQWLEKRYPSLATHLDNEISNLPFE